MAALDLKLTDKLLIVAGLTMSSAAAYVWNSPQLMSRLIQVQISQSGKSVGTVKAARNDTRRKYSGSLSWHPLESEQQLFENDTLFSGENSAAEVEVNFDNNPIQLKLAANTLVRVSRVNGEGQIDLQIGSVTSNLKKGQKVNLKIGGNNTILESSQDSNIQITKSGSNLATFASAKGNVKLTTKGQSTVIEQNKKVEVLNQKIQLDSLLLDTPVPAEGDILITNEKETINFDWKKQKDIRYENIKIQISQQATFQKISAEIQASKKTTTSDKLDDSGTYYWRLAMSDNSKFSDSRFFTLIKKNKFEGITPNDKSLIPQSSEPTTNVLFKWTPLVKVENYAIEFSNDEKFESLLQAYNTTLTTHEAQFESGLYYWRVKATLSNRETLTTPIRMFAIGKAKSFSDFLNLLNTPPPLPKPKINPLLAKYSKSDLKIVKIGDIIHKVTPNKLTEPYKLEVKLEKSLPDDEVRVKLANNKNFKNAIQKDSSEDILTFDLSENGDYFLSANYISNKGKIIAKPKDRRSFKFTAITYVETPALRQPDNDLKMVSFGNADVSIYFEWKKIPYATKYIFQISANPDFSRVLNEEIVSDNSYYLNEKFLQNRLYWRVKAMHKNLSSDWSKFRTILLSSPKKRGE